MHRQLLQPRRFLQQSRNIPLLLVLLLLSACVQIQQSDTAMKQALTHVNLCYTTHNATQLLGWYARQEGIFEKFGLDVDLILIGGGSKAVAAMIAGEVDFCITSGAPVTNANVAGADTVLVAGLYNVQLYSLMVRPEITSADDLRGKILGISDAGGQSDRVTRRALQFLELVPDQDVTLLTIGEQGERLAAMESGQIVGTLVNIPETLRAREAGFVELLDLTTMNVPQMRSGIASTRSYLAENPETARAFMKAIATAIASIKNDKTGAEKAIAEFLEYDPVENAELLDETFTILIQKHLEKIPYPNLAGIQEDLSILALENPEAEKFTPENIVETSILQELESDGFFAKLYQ